MTDSSDYIHIITRALIIDNGHVLVCVNKGNRLYSCLPGGKISHGEKLEDSLVKIFYEDVGHCLKVESYVGAMESGWHAEQKQAHEINMIFNCTSPELSCFTQPASKSAHSDLAWVKVSDLSNALLRPRALQAAIPTWYSQQKPGMFLSEFVKPTE
ncbi:MAG: NUDIX domain-containing protein [Alphaproteobacteria bacterium]